MIKKLITTTLLAVGIAVFTASASDNTNSVSLYNAKELGVSLSTGYVVDRSAAFQNNYAFNLTAGLNYSLNRFLVGEVHVPFYSTKGASLSEVQAGGYVRLPLGRLAPYVGASTVYNWNSQNRLAYIGKLGLEFRFNPKFGVFAEGQYRNNDFNLNNGSTQVVGGLRLTF